MNRNLIYAVKCFEEELGYKLPFTRKELRRLTEIFSMRVFPTCFLKRTSFFWLMHSIGFFNENESFEDKERWFQAFACNGSTIGIDRFFRFLVMTQKSFFKTKNPFLIQERQEMVMRFYGSGGNFNVDDLAELIFDSGKTKKASNEIAKVIFEEYSLNGSLSSQVFFQLIEEGLISVDGLCQAPKGLKLSKVLRK
jgi:hypothetical protein